MKFKYITAVDIKKFFRMKCAFTKEKLKNTASSIVSEIGKYHLVSTYVCSFHVMKQTRKLHYSIFKNTTISVA